MIDERKSIEMDVELDFNDFWSVLFWQGFKSLWIMYVLTVVVSLPMLIIGFYGVLTNANAKISPAILLPVLPLIAVLLNQYSIYSSAKKGLESVKGKTHWEFSEIGFEVFTPIAKSENKWESLEKVEEKTKVFLLYPQKNIFMLIPKRFFESETQITDFRELVRSQLGAKAKLKNK